MRTGSVKIAEVKIVPYAIMNEVLKNYKDVLFRVVRER